MWENLLGFFQIIFYFRNSLRKAAKCFNGSVAWAKYWGNFLIFYVETILAKCCFFSLRNKSLFGVDFGRDGRRKKEQEIIKADFRMVVGVWAKSEWGRMCSFVHRSRNESIWVGFPWMWRLVIPANSILAPFT